MGEQTRAARELGLGGRVVTVIGGGGTGYPEWARREFVARRLAEGGRDGPDALRSFLRAHNSEALREWAQVAGIPAFEVSGEVDRLADGSRVPLGYWLRFVK